MNGTLVEADWAPLTLPEVRALLADFPDFLEPIKILSASPRPFSAASVVSASSQHVFIKRHHRKVRDREGLVEEHRFMRYLREHGAQVPQIFVSTSGETAIEMGECTYEVHETPAGVDLYEDALSWTPFRSTAHVRSAGETLARIHLASQGFDAPQRKTQPLVASFTIFAEDDANAEMERYLAARPALTQDAKPRADCDEALKLLSPFYDELKPLLPALKPLWTHNDLHASNLFWSDASDDAHATTVIDFGLVDRTNAVHDLALTIERNIVEWLRLREGSEDEQGIPVHLNHLAALLDGYESVRQLSDEEAAALAPMTALCHAEFALTEADYFLGVVHSKENGRVCTEGYLVGHARWFHGAGGRKLLDAIRQWGAKRKRQGAALAGARD
jgi:Ser/Thr protein kinase RdoA (MazF antagonist)